MAFKFPVIGNRKPRVETLAPTVLPMAADRLTVGHRDPLPYGRTINAKVHPGGRPCVWSVEYATDAEWTMAPNVYTEETDARPLPGKLNAYFAPDFAAAGNCAGARHLVGGVELPYVDEEGGFGHHDCTAHQSADGNHTDTFYVELAALFYLGPYPVLTGDAPDPISYAELYLGGLKPDVRGAKLSFKVRGNDFDPGEPSGGAGGTNVKICPWAQYDKDQMWKPGNPDPSDYEWKPNWANTGNDYRALLGSGDWEDVNLQINSNTNEWTFVGSNIDRLAGWDEETEEYKYAELDSGLAAITCDLFLGMLTGVNTGSMPTGTIDFANVSLQYRNHNLCAPQNGGSLTDYPTGGTDPSKLTDGWRNGPGHTWQSAATPFADGPPTFVYQFANAVDLECVVISNDEVYPARNLRLYWSDNGIDWTAIDGERPLGDLNATPFSRLPATDVLGRDHLFQAWTLTNNAAEPYFWDTLASGVTHLKVEILDSWANHGGGFDPDDPTVVGLGSIEAFGTGAESSRQTDNAWYFVSQDLELAAGDYHYRVKAVTDLGTVYGEHQTFTVV